MKENQVDLTKLSCVLLYKIKKDYLNAKAAVKWIHFEFKLKFYFQIFISSKEFQKKSPDLISQVK